ncbi:ATP-grasp domain-containing protein [Chondromyces apiculatus]|uniref:ATP-dependent carboxylate-amine ligase domain protein, ATP-grasp n=1 Tax=Chondromyces apiculatus DSM 436 TaxID=1192034 RepID=A0A017T7N8_9BACT|nr:ATP-grasp domain-containing protein [Chondromyces apiculatus]EYF04825.1 ATP-dependent carboxylate-amine ligase domain protein, ATP-grasp [Chondromyces apiculatus DSM 436]
MEHQLDVPATEPTSSKIILCVASFYKGNDFLDQCKREGWKVVLLTHESLLTKPWVRESIDEVWAMPSFTDWRAVENAVCYLARTRDFSRIAPLDDYDVELVAHLREHLRIPGMGETTARYFRDKLAMRARARDRGINVPEFIHVLNHDRIRRFCREVPAPWLLKPRAEASSVGIRKLQREEDIWPIVEELGDKQPAYLIERMIPGDVFHVDAIISERKVVFAEVHRYRKPLLEVTHSGGIFASRTVERGSEVERKILDTHRQVVEQMSFVRGVMHAEYILGRDDGKVYFLETAARVGGAHIVDLVQASTGINLWREWARVELAQGEHPYTLPEHRRDYGGLIVSLARQEVPDTSAFSDPEIVWRLENHPHHVGFALRAPTGERIDALLDEYEPRILRDYMAVLPAPLTPTA